MATTIYVHPSGETIKTVEDKVRDLPANQGKNESAMWVLIDAEIVAVAAASGLRVTERYDTNGKNKHGN